jgi:hypothetical protein
MAEMPRRNALLGLATDRAIAPPPANPILAQIQRQRVGAQSLEPSMTNQTGGFNPLVGWWNGQPVTQSQAADLPVDPFTGKLGEGARMVAEGLMGATTSPVAGKLYHRFTNAGPDNGVGYMMFADDYNKVSSGYGKNHYTVDASTIPPGEIVEAGSFDFMKKVMRALSDAPHLTERFQASAKRLAGDAVPSDIVNHAGLWDSPDLVEEIWSRVMEPNGWSAVRTPNGLVTFDPAHVSKGRGAP